MKLSILTPSKKLVTEVESSEVFVPGVEGEIEILPDHASFLTELETGVVRWKDEAGSWGVAAISYGWLEVLDNKISILADVGELASHIDEARAKKAETIAFQKVTEGGMSDEDYKKHELKLKRAISRLTASKLN
ncbi:MAG: ATP synthase F1 subunit epsilon [Bdellovibrionota bacterium]